MGFNRHDISRDACMLTSGKFVKKGYDWWWHSFTGVNAVTGEKKAFSSSSYVIPRLVRISRCSASCPRTREPRRVRRI